MLLPVHSCWDLIGRMIVLRAAAAAAAAAPVLRGALVYSAVKQLGHNRREQPR